MFYLVSAILVVFKFWWILLLWAPLRCSSDQCRFEWWMMVVANIQCALEVFDSHPFLWGEPLVSSRYLRCSTHTAFFEALHGQIFLLLSSLGLSWWIVLKCFNIIPYHEINFDELKPRFRDSIWFHFIALSLFCNFSLPTCSIPLSLLFAHTCPAHFGSLHLDGGSIGAAFEMGEWDPHQGQSSG